MARKDNVCNSRRVGYADRIRKMEPGKWGGEGYCAYPAGAGTNHLGRGRCCRHGGNNPIRRGYYSKITRESLAELVAHFEQVGDPLDVTNELALARAYLLQFVEHYDDVVSGVLTWYAEYLVGDDDAYAKAKKKPPPKIPNEMKIIQTIDTISKIIKRVQDVKSDQAVTRSDLFRIMGEMGRIVEHHCSPEDWEKVKNDWLTIKLA